MTRSLREAALGLAARGIPVFACLPDKRPLSRHGFHAATTDLTAVCKMFLCQNAALIGMPTGRASGIDVLDIDYRHGGDTWERDHGPWLPETRCHQTMSGGRHLLFAADVRVHNSCSRIAPGIDVRGEGGYVIVPPSPGYRIIANAEIAPWPDWLLVPGSALPPIAPPRPPVANAYTPTASPRLEGYLRCILGKVSSAPDGQKHFRLRNAGLALGGIADQLGLSNAEAVGWLMSALPPGVKDWKAAQRTAEWAFAAGRLKPITLEDRAERVHSRPLPMPVRRGAA